MFMGETLQFWVELKAKSENLDVTYLIRENAELRAKVSYFEDMIKKANQFININKEN